jgi:signal transduction histidine kinase
VFFQVKNFNMEPYTDLPIVLVAVGLALLGTIAYLARLVRRHRRSLGALLKLAKINLDPLQLPAASWPTLAGGGIIRLHFSGNWFGQPVQGEFGETQAGGKPFTFTITAHDDVHLEFELYAKTHRGEARLFTENLAEVFRLLLETAVHGKMQALSIALTEQARLSLYLQHDLRNLAQWVEWVAADFAVAKSNEELFEIARHLHTSAHHAAARARRILDATCHTRSPPLPVAIALADAIHQAAEHAGIGVTIERDARVLLRRDLLDRTLDNLFTNAAPLLRSHPYRTIAVSIVPEAGKICAQIRMPRLAQTAHPEKLFEPFSSGRPGGLGLGLYQARKSLKEAGGEMTAELCGDDICFSLSLPGVESAQV